MLPDDLDIKIMTLDEVAEFLKVHRSTVTRYSLSGELRSYNIGTRRMFKYHEVVQFFDNRISLESRVGSGYGKEK